MKKIVALLFVICGSAHALDLGGGLKGAAEGAHEVLSRQIDEDAQARLMERQHQLDLDRMRQQHEMEEQAAARRRNEYAAQQREIQAQLDANQKMRAELERLQNELNAIKATRNTPAQPCKTKECIK